MAMKILKRTTLSTLFLFGAFGGSLALAAKTSEAAPSIGVYLEQDEDEIGARLFQQMRHWQIANGALVLFDSGLPGGRSSEGPALKIWAGEGELGVEMVSFDEQDLETFRRVASAFRDEYTTQDFEPSVETKSAERGMPGISWSVTFTGTPRHSIQARQLRLMIHSTLRELGLVESETASIAPPVEARGEFGPEAVFIAVFDDGGAALNGVQAMERIQQTSSDWNAYRVSAADVRAGALEQFDVAMFTGGRGGAQGTSLAETGREEVRRFVDSGGGYLGICAGAFLATARLDSYLDLLHVYHYLPWAQGRGQVDVELSETGRTLFGRDAGVFEVRYNNGPLFFSEKDFIPELPATTDFEVLAYFRSGVKGRDNAESQQKVNTPAIVRATSGEGRLLLISPHPESNVEYDWLLRAAVEAVTPKRG